MFESNLNILENIVIVGIVVTTIMIIGLILLRYELKSIREKEKSKVSITLSLFLVSLNLMYFMRFMGIMMGNEQVRFFGPTLFALLSAVLLMNWGSMLMNLQDNWRYLAIFITVLGMTFFLIGRLSEFVFIEITGVSFLLAVIIVMFTLLLRHAFKKSPYIVARQRIFLLTSGFILIAIGGGLGAIFLGAADYNKSALFFILELPARLLITMGILIPPKVQEILRKIIS